MKLINNFSATDLTFSEVKKDPRGGKFISVSANGAPVRLQVSSLRAPFGINEPNPSRKVLDYSMSLNLTPDLVEKFQEIEEAVLNHVHENSVALLHKQVEKNIMKDILMTPIAKPPKDEKYAHTIKLKVSTGGGKNIVAQFFDSNRNKIGLEDVKSGSIVDIIVELGQIWFINGKFGLSIRLLQVKVCPSNKLDDYAFIETEQEVLDIPEEI